MLGPAFVKAGQVLGTRRDVLPGALCDELSMLQDAMPPMTPAQARRGLAAAYGPSGVEGASGACRSFGSDRRSGVNEASSADGTGGTGGTDGTGGVSGAVPFGGLDWRPVASGSVACVYAATLPSGERVAVKLRRVGVERAMRRDLALLRGGARVAARLRPLRGVPVTEVVDGMCAAVLGQLDFAREADGLTRLRDALAAVPRVWVPKVHADASRPRCIVMEFVPGLALDTAASCPPALRRRFAASALTAVYHMLFVTGCRFAASALTAVYHMLFVTGFVHCDMHPGNLYFTRSGQVVVLDAGFSVQLSDRLRRLFAEFFLNMATGRGRRCAEIVVESAAAVRPDADLEAFTVRMADLVERSHGLPAREFSLIAFAAEMFDLQRRHGIHAASELVFPLLSLLVIEGTIRDLDPGIDFQEVARPVLNRGLFGARA
ncbi:AarF/ABC1/UbiB kinase family protein [Actinomadura logoneensis]|uniref:AarF/ABC1/UbiB kinase family protein n=2 Tax=Actinomadura logoneensis TaxID=2293572 RepID=A0A372JQQ4_9ACTN|nr:AarF/ABC1/UbiB kinase family protein [Actinomadura logoneensis]